MPNSSSKRCKYVAGIWRLCRPRERHGVQYPEQRQRHWRQRQRLGPAAHHPHHGKRSFWVLVIVVVYTNVALLRLLLSVHCRYIELDDVRVSNRGPPQPTALQPRLHSFLNFLMFPERCFVPERFDSDSVSRALECPSVRTRPQPRPSALIVTDFRTLHFVRVRCAAQNTRQTCSQRCRLARRRPELLCHSGTHSFEKPRALNLQRTAFAGSPNSEATTFLQRPCSLAYNKALRLPPRPFGPAAVVRRLCAEPLS